MNKLYILGSFVLGAAAGACTAWYILKDKYEKLAQEEIDEVREHYYVKMKAEKRTQELEEKTEPEMSTNDILEFAKNKPSVAEYAKKLNDMKYHDYTNTAPEPDEDEDDEYEDPIPPYEPYFDPDGKPEIISPDEFGDDDTFSRITLTYFADGYLTDEDYVPVENMEGTVGLEWEKHFGEYEDDSVYVRNTRLHCEYEILADLRNYSDVVETLPPSRRI